MTATFTDDPQTTQEEEELTPDADKGQLFDLPLATVTLDDTDPTVLKLSFSGGIELDRTKPDDVALYNSLRAGKTASLHIDAHIAGTKTTHRRDAEGNVDAVVQTKSILVHSIDTEA